MHPLFVPFRGTPSVGHVVRRWGSDGETSYIPETDTRRRSVMDVWHERVPGCRCGRCNVHSRSACIKRRLWKEEIFIRRIRNTSDRLAKMSAPSTWTGCWQCTLYSVLMTCLRTFYTFWL